MTSALLRLHWLMLRRDRSALVLAFLLPLVFFSVFTFIYLQIVEVGEKRILRATVVDLDKSELSRRFVSMLQTQPGLTLSEIQTGSRSNSEYRQQALTAVRRGRVPVAVVVLPNFERTMLATDSLTPAIELLEDRSDAMASAVSQALFAPALNRLAAEERIRQALDTLRSLPGLGEAISPQLPSSAELLHAIKPIAIKRVDVLGSTTGGTKRAAVAYFAAGTGVLFLLFTMAGAAATLLDEARDGTLERLQNCGVRTNRLLLYKWLFSSLLGITQVCLMFIWAWAVFDLDLFTLAHLSGFALITLLTALAASAVGLVLATACRSRAQFNALSTVLILIMSALGGSMFPRFLMSDALKTVGLATFNAWAVDGYQKVFWYESTILGLWPQISVLAITALVLIAIAQLLARKWEFE